MINIGETLVSQFVLCCSLVVGVDTILMKGVVWLGYVTHTTLVQKFDGEDFLHIDSVQNFLFLKAHR